jgi:hypothetical protein
MSVLRSDGAHFDWNNDEAIVVREQSALAVYTNMHGAAVLREQRGWDEEADTYIVIAPENAIRVAYAILGAANHGDIRFYRPSRSGDGYEDVEIDELGGPLAWRPPAEGNAKKPKDTTAPERQKRYRDRKRQAVTASVTLDAGVTHDRNGRNVVTPNGVTTDEAVMGDQIGNEAGTGELFAELFPKEAAA